MPARKPYVKAPIKKQPRVFRTWSTFQTDIFADINHGQGNTQVDALAGTGKTSTCCEGFYHVPPNTSVLMCAFNASIKKELEVRAPVGVDVSTIHSMGYGACRTAFPRLGKIDDRGEKLGGYIKAEVGDDSETYELRDNLAKAVSLCKGYLAHTPEEIEPVLDRHEIDTCTESRESFTTMVMKIMNACKKDTSRIDFDDMIWLPNVLGLKLRQFDMVFIDEAQDLNKAQIELALASVRPGGRIISVGDEHQAIYGFRGADSNAIQNIVDRMGSKRLPLSVTYRCAKSIVEMAQTIVPELQAAPGAEQGLVEEMSINQLENKVRPGDFVLSRVNAPLIKWCLALLKAKIPANIQGRDLGKSLTAMIKKSGAKDVDAFLSWLTEWETMEVERLCKAKRDSSVICDKADCLRTLSEGTRSLAEMKENIDDLFHDGDDHNRVILSSTHKAKGLERDRVFMLRDTYRNGRKPDKGGGQEEDNLAYVAITRAKKELYLVSGK
jgi:DNA helicase-2/ATP-dependent DNA helicase PcrA